MTGAALALVVALVAAPPLEREHEPEVLPAGTAATWTGVLVARGPLERCSAALDPQVQALLVPVPAPEPASARLELLSAPGIAVVLAAVGLGLGVGFVVGSRP